MILYVQKYCILCMGLDSDVKGTVRKPYEVRRTTSLREKINVVNILISDTLQKKKKVQKKGRKEQRYIQTTGETVIYK